jgi:hypothetical protein
MSPLRKLETPTKSQLQAGYLSTTFLTPLALASFVAAVKRTFINFPMAHHNLGSFRAMPSHLGGFTSKSNKCHEDCFAKLKCSQRGSHSTQTWIYHKLLKPHKEVLRRGHKGLEMSMFLGWLQQPPKEGGEAFILTLPPTQTNHWELGSKNQNIRFWNRNIRNLNYICYSPNRMLQFGKPEHPVFQGSKRGGVSVAIIFHASHLGF